MIVASEEDALEFAQGFVDAKSASSRKEMKEISNLQQYTHVVFNLAGDAKIARIVKTKNDLMVCERREEHIDDYECYVILSQVPLQEGDDYFFISTKDYSPPKTPEKDVGTKRHYVPISHEDLPVAYRLVETGAGGDCYFSSYSKILEQITDWSVTSLLQETLHKYTFHSRGNRSSVESEESESWSESKAKTQAVRNICAKSFMNIANSASTNKGKLWEETMVHILATDSISLDELNYAVRLLPKQIIPSASSIPEEDRNELQQFILSSILEAHDVNIRDEQYDLFKSWVASRICKMGPSHQGTAWDTYLLDKHFTTVSVTTITRKTLYRFEYVTPFRPHRGSPNEMAKSLLDSVRSATHRAFIVYLPGLDRDGHYQTLLCETNGETTFLCDAELACSIVEDAWNNYRKKLIISVDNTWYKIPLNSTVASRLGVDRTDFETVMNNWHIAESFDSSYHKVQRREMVTIDDMQIKSYHLMRKYINLLKPRRRVLMKLVPLSLLDKDLNPYPFDAKVQKDDSTWQDPDAKQERMILFTVERYMQIGIYDKEFITCFANDMRAYVTHQIIDPITDTKKNRVVFVGVFEIGKEIEYFVCRTFVNAEIYKQGDTPTEALDPAKCNKFFRISKNSQRPSHPQQKIVVHNK